MQRRKPQESSGDRGSNIGEGVKSRYFLAFQIFRDHGLNVIGVPTEDDIREGIARMRSAFDGNTHDQL
jgi:hypothetical protein